MKGEVILSQLLILQHISCNMCINTNTMSTYSTFLPEQTQPSKIFQKFTIYPNPFNPL